ncbi:MAG: hypothetical protein Q4B88_04695 [Moraxella sp.]|nr:hypothetical protein [Moraxella sp.]
MTKRNPIPPGSRPPQSNNGQVSQTQTTNTSNLTYITEDYRGGSVKPSNGIFDGLSSGTKKS